jgi:hypothetical protein
VTAAPEDGLTAALLRLNEHSERIGQIDQREGEHFRHVSDALAKLHTTVNGMKGTITDQAEILAGLDGLDEAVAELTEQVASLLPPAPEAEDRYQPAETIRWWTLDDDAKAEATARLRHWVSYIYRPHYGHLAAQLGDCWEQHPLCLVLLDWLSELWSVLYLSSPRSARDLAAQSEFATRILPAAAEQMGTETATCAHSRVSATGNGAYAGGVR